MIPPSIWPWKDGAESPSSSTTPQATPAEWLDFVASMSTSLAWPIIVLVLFFALRMPLTSLLVAVRDRVPTMTSLETLGIKVGWSERGVREAVNGYRTAARHYPPSSSRTSTAAEQRKTTALRLAEIEPSAGVIHAFIGVELALADLLSGHRDTALRSPLSRLSKSNLPRELQESVREFAELRNAAAHGRSGIEIGPAREYIEGVSELEQTLRNW